MSYSVSRFMMFPMSGNALIRETAPLGDALKRLAALLPASWQLNRVSGPTVGKARVDAVVELAGPNGAGASFVVEAKRSGAMPIAQMLATLRELQVGSGLPVLFASDYIGPALREALAEAGMSYVDATGWVRVACEDPLILLTGIGAQRAPRSQQRLSAVVRLNGVAANRIIRTLCETPPPLGVRELAGLAEVSAGSVSKLLVTLAAEGVVDRDEASAVVAVRRRALIRRWVSDYFFAESNSVVRYCIAPRGLERALSQVGEQAEIALTGSAAARRMLPTSATSVVPLRQLALYATDPAGVAEASGLIDADPASSNVVIARPQDLDILRRSTVERRIVLAPVALVLADLLTLPGRSDAEAEQLMDALAANDPAWRL
ncbi:MAG: helix-turn-helix domain-containing protein [Sporichthyaceae bacterium]